MNTPKSAFFNHIQDSLTTNSFVKLIISNRRIKGNDLKSVHVKQVLIKKGIKLSFVYRHEYKDITKNHEISEGIEIIKNLIQDSFLQADLFTTQKDCHYKTDFNKKEKLTYSGPTILETPNLAHDKIKSRLIEKKGESFLYHLGIINSDGSIKKDMNDKYRQINKYVEIIDSVLKSSNITDKISIADMGCGKGYLTFALYDYLISKTTLKPEVCGIEQRPELVEYCNKIAQQSGFDHLNFQPGTIVDSKIENIDMLIALHACDTATDEAIYKGIMADAKIIICAPCCHKQIRAEMKPVNVLKNVTQYGILLERQAEIITDTIRALILKAYGYKSNVFEFIGTEHTPKNLLIVGVKKSKINDEEKLAVLQEIKTLKELYSIRKHHLETLLNLI